MTLQELYTELKTGMSIPIAYQEFPDTQSPPYAAFFEVDTETITADGIVVAESSFIEIHLITKFRDLALENQIESILKNCVVTWERSVERDDTQKIYDTFYELTLINGKD